MHGHMKLKVADVSTQYLHLYGPSVWVNHLIQGEATECDDFQIAVLMK
jgi:hypothetical protein